VEWLDLVHRVNGGELWKSSQRISDESAKLKNITDLFSGPIFD
jgi:hypothetical protein